MRIIQNIILIFKDIGEIISYIFEVRFPNHKKYLTCTLEEALLKDKQAIASDWEAVAFDLKTVIKDVEACKEYKKR